MQEGFLVLPTQAPGLYILLGLPVAEVRVQPFWCSIFFPHDNSYCVPSSWRDFSVLSQYSEFLKLPQGKWTQGTILNKLCADTSRDLMKIFNLMKICQMKQRW